MTNEEQILEQLQRLNHTNENILNLLQMLATKFNNPQISSPLPDNNFPVNNIESQVQQRIANARKKAQEQLSSLDQGAQWGKAGPLF